MEEKKITIGGQAVIEGVMMRGPELTATAVRTPEGKIEISSRPVNSISDRYPILKKPLLRGCVSLIESLVIGIRSLGYLPLCWQLFCLLLFLLGQLSFFTALQRIQFS